MTTSKEMTWQDYPGGSVRSDGAKVEEFFRFWSKVKIQPGCWEWTGSVMTIFLHSKRKFPYGRCKFGGKQMLAHRVAYLCMKGKIPEGFVVDHLCRNPSCVNPDHLEVVTQQINTLRGDGLASQNAVKTHCKHGHPLSDENLYLNKEGKRQCRICGRKSRREYKARCRAKQEMDYHLGIPA